MSDDTRSARFRRLGTAGPVVAAVALGCSSMSGLTGAGADDELAAGTIRAAVDQGVDLIDTADFYGLGHNESLIARALTGVPRDRYLLSDKFSGLRDPSSAFLGTDCRPTTLKTFLAYSLQRLRTDHVDVYRPARLDPAVPIEETVGAIAELVQAGYVRGIGLSEVSAQTIRRAHAVRSVTSRSSTHCSAARRKTRSSPPAANSESGSPPTGCSVTGCSGLLGADDTGAPPHLPRLHGDNRRANLAVAGRLQPIAARSGASLAQLAIAWVLAQGAADGDVVAVVGAGRPERITDILAATDLELSETDLADIEQAVPRSAVAGDRYAPSLMAMLDSDQSAVLTGQGRPTSRSASGQDRPKLRHCSVGSCSGGCPEVRGTSVAVRCRSSGLDFFIVPGRCDSFGGDALEFGGEFR